MTNRTSMIFTLGCELDKTDVNSVIHGKEGEPRLMVEVSHDKLGKRYMLHVQFQLLEGGWAKSLVHLGAKTKIAEGARFSAKRLSDIAENVDKDILEGIIELVCDKSGAKLSEDGKLKLEQYSQK